MSSAWLADISMESLPGPRPVRPTDSSRPSMACFRQQSARLLDMHAFNPCSQSCFSLPENLASLRSTRMPAEPHYPLSFQKSRFTFSANLGGGKRMEDEALHRGIQRVGDASNDAAL